jgi:uncharacterized protein (TIRG00374 family)
MDGGENTKAAEKTADRQDAPAAEDTEAEAATAPAAQAPAPKHRWRWRVLRIVSVVVVIVVFAYVFPKLTSYNQAWHVVTNLTWPWLLALAGVTVVNLLSNWALITATLPGLRYDQAGAMNLSSTAVANTIPAGGAIAMGVTWMMLSEWGFGSDEFVVYSLVSGLWSQLAKFGTPVVALIALAATGHASGALILGAVAGTIVFVAVLAVVIAGMRSERFIGRIGDGAQRLISWVARLFRRTGPQRVREVLIDFRRHVTTLVARRGWSITFATLASDLMMWVVILTCLRACGVTSSEVSWQLSFAGYALVRLITTLPVTPGGLGVVEVGLTGYLAAGASAAVTSRIAAAVLLARALTYALPVPVGALTYASWRALDPRRRARRDARDADRDADQPVS